MRLAALALVACSSPSAWLTDESSAFARARDENKAVVIDLHAEWSMPSVELSRELDTMRARLDRDFVRLRIDVTKEDHPRYGSAGVLFVDRNGTVLARLHTPRDTRAVIADAAKKRSK